MENLYMQNFGNKRVIILRGMNEKDALIEDFKTGLEYAMAWNTFHLHHHKLEQPDYDNIEHETANLDRIIK